MRVPGTSDGNPMDGLDVRLVEPFAGPDRRAGSGKQKNLFELLSRDQELELRACMLARPGQRQGWISFENEPPSRDLTAVEMCGPQGALLFAHSSLPVLIVIDEYSPGAELKR